MIAWFCELIFLYQNFEQKKVFLISASIIIFFECIWYICTFIHIFLNRKTEKCYQPSCFYSKNIWKWTTNTSLAWIWKWNASSTLWCDWSRWWLCSRCKHFKIIVFSEVIQFNIQSLTRKMVSTLKLGEGEKYTSNKAQFKKNNKPWCCTPSWVHCCKT